jgi:hypothetical protein
VASSEESAFSCLYRFESSELATQVACPVCGAVALEIELTDLCYVSAIDIAFDDVLDTGELIVAEEAPPEIHECCVPTPQKALSC